MGAGESNVQLRSKHNTPVMPRKHPKSYTINLEIWRFEVRLAAQHAGCAQEEPDFI